MKKFFLYIIFHFLFLIPTFLSGDEKFLANTFAPNRFYIAPSWFVNNKSETTNSAFSMSVTNIWREEIGYQFAKRNSLYFYAREAWGGGPGLQTFNATKEPLISYPWFFETRIGYQLSLDKMMNTAITPYIGYFILGQDTYIASKTFPGFTQKAVLQNVIAGAMIDYIFNKNIRISALFNFLFGVSGEVKTAARIFPQSSVLLENKVNYLAELWVTWQITNDLDLTLVPSYIWENAATGYGTARVINTEANPGLRLELGYRM